MSKATIDRKERRKRFISKLKQGCYAGHSGDNSWQNMSNQPSFQDIFREVIAAAQHAFHAGFVEGCSFGESCVAKSNHVRTCHVASQTADMQKDVVQTRNRDPLLPLQKLEPRILTHDGRHTVHTPDTYAVGVQTGTCDSPFQFRKLEPRIFTHDGAFAVHAPDTCDGCMQTGTFDSFFQKA